MWLQLERLSNHGRTCSVDSRSTATRPGVVAIEDPVSFYGAEDFVPTEEYELADAEQAIQEAHLVLDVVRQGLLATGLNP